MLLTSTQISSAIRRKILEQTSDLVTDEVLFFNMNLAYDDIKIRTFTNDQIKTATVAFTAGVGTLPADFGTLYGPGFKTTTDKTPFEEKSIADFNRDGITEAMTIEGGTIKVSPDSTTSLIIKYYPTYAELTALQNPEINSYLHELIIPGTIYRIYEDLQDETLSAYWKNVFDTDITTKSGYLSNYQEDNSDGGQMFNYVRII